MRRPHTWLQRLAATSMTLLLAGGLVAFTPMTALAAGEGCRGSTCNGQDPRTKHCDQGVNYGTWATATLAKPGGGVAGTVELQYNTYCQAMWTKLLNQSGSAGYQWIEIQLDSGTYLTEIDYVGVGGYSYGNMLYVPSPRTARSVGRLCSNSSCTLYRSDQGATGYYRPW